MRAGRGIDPSAPIHSRMEVIVNGERIDLPDSATLEDLVRRLGLDRSACAAEVNKDLVPRRERAERRLREGDRVELVSLVGGG